MLERRLDRGPQSRLRGGLYEAVGHLVDHVPNGERHIAVVPRTELTERLAERMTPRARKIGIEIVLIDPTGHVALSCGGL